MKINPGISGLLAVGYMTISVTAFAAVDTKQKMICAIMEAKSCELRTGCDTGGADMVNLPDFVTVDVPSNKITGIRPDGTALATPIERVESADGVTVLQGGEEGVGWSINITLETGRMTVSASSEDTGLLIFGTCTQ